MDKIIRFKNIGQNKRGQEEIVGFVLIMVIVAVVFLVFLGIMIRNSGKTGQGDSTIAYQFLESAMEQTTDCALSVGGSYLKLDELISECYATGNNCASGKGACLMLNETLGEMLENSWVVSNGSALKGYEFESVYSFESDSQSDGNEEIVRITKGDCGGSAVGNSYFLPEFPGRIITTFRMCY